MDELDINYVVLPPYSPKMSPAAGLFITLQKKFKTYRFLKKKVSTPPLIEHALNEIMSASTEPTSNYPIYFKRLGEYLSDR